MTFQAVVKNPRKILIVVMPYLGDVLLATPLLRSIKQAYPNAQIDVLVYHSTAAMLEGNPDIHQVLTIANRPGLNEHWQLIKQIFRRYDLAMALQTSDRSFFYTLLAASRRVNAVPNLQSKTRWKRHFAQSWVEFDDEHTHTVLQNLKLLQPLNITAQYTLVPPRVDNLKQLHNRFDFLVKKTNYAVLHIHPQWHYKRWSETGWIELSRYLHGRGLTLLFTGSAAVEELKYIQSIISKITI